jgi:hypothetical protein
MKPLQRPDSEWDLDRDKWNLWPWKHWMTVGIGVLCSEGKERPDHLILACDALGSFGDVNCTASLHKLFSRHDARIYLRHPDYESGRSSLGVISRRLYSAHEIIRLSPGAVSPNKMSDGGR